MLESFEKEKEELEKKIELEKSNLAEEMEARRELEKAELSKSIFILQKLSTQLYKLMKKRKWLYRYQVINSLNHMFFKAWIDFSLRFEGSNFFFIKQITQLDTKPYLKNKKVSMNWT